MMREVLMFGRSMSLLKAAGFLSPKQTHVPRHMFLANKGFVHLSRREREHRERAVQTYTISDAKVMPTHVSFDELEHIAPEITEGLRQSIETAHERIFERMMFGSSYEQG